MGTIEVPDRWRSAIAAYYGQDGLADRDTCRRFILSCGTEDIHLAMADDDDDEGEL